MIAATPNLQSIAESDSLTATATTTTTTTTMPSTSHPFNVNTAYMAALDDQQVPHPLAAILALTRLIEASTASTLTGLLTELMAGRKSLVDTQPSLGVRAGCQLFERFVSSSGAGEDFISHKRSLIEQGRSFCAVTAPECRNKIAELAVGFIRDDCVILTHSYSRTVIQALVKAHNQNKRIKVYVAEARPQGLGLKTHQILTQAGIPCTVILDSSIAYILERVDIVLVGTEAVVESGGLVSRIGTAQTAHLARAMGKPFYALAESYKFLRYYPLTQSDLPMPKSWGRRIPLEFDPLDDDLEEEIEEDVRRARTGVRSRSKGCATAPATPRRVSLVGVSPGTTNSGAGEGEGGGGDDEEGQTAGLIPRFTERWEMTREMEAKNPLVDVTSPDLIDLVITDLGAISSESVSQYLVALFST